MNLFMTWFLDADILEFITSGGIAYELSRPIDLYNIWYVKGLSSRLSKTILRYIPIILIAINLPKPFNLVLPSNFGSIITFGVSIVLGFGVVVAF